MEKIDAPMGSMHPELGIGILPIMPKGHIPILQSTDLGNYKHECYRDRQDLNIYKFNIIGTFNMLFSSPNPKRYCNLSRMIVYNLAKS